MSLNHQVTSARDGKVKRVKQERESDLSYQKPVVSSDLVNIHNIMGFGNNL